MNQPNQPLMPPPPSASRKVPRPESVHAHKLVGKNQINRIIIWVIVVLILGGLGFGGYKVYKAVTFEPTATSQKTELNIDPQVKEQVQSSIHHGQKLSPAEGGVGREDPFAPY